jgi:hypothetical protein
MKANNATFSERLPPSPIAHHADLFPAPIEVRPYVCAALPAGLADKSRLNIGQPEIIRPLIGANRDRVADAKGQPSEAQHRLPAWRRREAGLSLARPFVSVTSFRTASWNDNSASIVYSKPTIASLCVCDGRGQLEVVDRGRPLKYQRAAPLCRLPVDPQN